MSASIMPDMYRHTARKSTVSKNLKTTNNNSSTTNYERNCKQMKLFHSIECNIKLETDESFLILPDNEIEQMIIEEDQNEIINDILQDIINQIIQSSSNISLENSNQVEEFCLKRSLSIDTQDVQHVIGSIMNQFNEIDNTESFIEENVNISSDEIPSMDIDQQSSILSRSQIDDDIVEIEPISSNDPSPSCTCLCHQPISPLNNEYILFEQALKKTRLEQEKEKSLNNNHLIQTLKRQHDELIHIYQQNKTQKQISITKIDREQQTTKLHLHDSQIQTDLTTLINNNSKSLSPEKSLVNNGSTSRKYSASLPNPNQTPLQMAPRLSATTTVTTKTAIVINAQTTLPPPPPLSSTVVPHDIVDLTEEEDEDDNINRVPIQRTTSTRQSTSSIQPPTSTTVPTATAARTRPVNRAIRPNSVTTNGQTFPLRPLPEHIPCDHTIARPQLSITQENATVRLTWNLQSTPMESIQNYEIYAYKQNATATASDWKKIGTVKSMRLPMAVTLKEFQSNSHYAFAVRAVSMNNNIGPFCEPKTIFTGSTLVQPLHTSQLLNVST